MRDADLRERVAAVEQALAGLERLDEPARTTAHGAVAALVDLYGEALARVVERCGDGIAGDELIGHLLLAHGLHPVAVEERIAQALDEVRPYLGSHGGGVELVAVQGTVARVRLHGTCNGCPSSATTLRLAVEEAVLRAAPELERVEAEPGAEPAAAPLIQLECLPGAFAR